MVKGKGEKIMERFVRAELLTVGEGNAFSMRKLIEQIQTVIDRFDDVRDFRVSVDTEEEHGEITVVWEGSAHGFGSLVRWLKSGEETIVKKSDGEPLALVNVLD